MSKVTSRCPFFFTKDRYPDGRSENFEALLNHMLEHFRNEPQLSRGDLRDDDEDMLVTAWKKHEIWEAHWNPQVPEKHAERLFAEDFSELKKKLEAAHYDSTKYELTLLREFDAYAK